MVETIAPVVYGSRSRYIVSVTIHALSATAAAGIFGAALGLVGSVLGAPWGRAGAAVVVALALAYFLREAAGVPVPTFDRKRQVPEWWRTFFSPPVTAALYGAGLGIGFLTFLGHGTLVVVVALAVAWGDPFVGAALVAPFGFARGMSVLITARSSDETEPARIVARLSDLAARTRWSRLANAAACGALAVAAFTSCAQPDTVTYADRSPSPTLSPTTIGYGRPRIVGRIADPRVVEASGITASRRHPGVLWVHNDSGDGPTLYCTRLNGSSCGRFTVEGADHYDWEDIALGPGPGGADHLYIGDIGDNDRVRAAVIVYRVAEPVEVGGAGTLTAERVELRYPDGSHDAETLMVHPASGDLFIVTKETSSGARVYAARSPLGRAAVMERVARIDIGSALDPVTGGAIAPDGRRVILATYARGYELSGPDFTSIWSSELVRVPLGRRPQGEAVTYSADGAFVYATSEGEHPAIWAVPRT